LTDSSSIAGHKAFSLYLDCARSARPLNTPPGSQSQPTGHVANHIRPIETRSLPALTRSYPRHFTLDHSHFHVLAPATLAALPPTHAISQTRVFYVAYPIRSIPVFLSTQRHAAFRNSPLQKLQQPIFGDDCTHTDAWRFIGKKFAMARTSAIVCTRVARTPAARQCAP
jgi:hypothetical protein